MAVGRSRPFLVARDMTFRRSQDDGPTPRRQDVPIGCVRERDRDRCVDLGRSRLVIELRCRSCGLNCVQIRRGRLGTDLWWSSV